MTPEPYGPDIVEFAMSREYLAKDYLSVTQVAILKGLYGLPMERDERLAFLEVTEGRPPEPKGYDEAAIICGVRSGKTELGGLVATFEGVRWAPVLADMLPPGKTAKVIIVAQNERGAGECREYIEGALQRLHDRHGGILVETSGAAKAITGRGIRLAGPVEYVIYPSKKASVRGATGLCFIGDEVAFWEAAEGAYNQDEKVMRAVRSRFATLSRLHPKRLLISSPDEEEGVLFEAYKHRFDRPKVMVVNAPSWKLNPSLDQEFLDAEQERDPEGFESEYGARFRKAGGSHCFLSAESIESCVEKGRSQNPPQPGVEYVAWMDAAFKRDRFSFGVGHAMRHGEETTVVVDHMRHWTPRQVAKGRKAVPLDEDEVVEALVADLRLYGLDRVHGDQFADVPLKNRFAKRGITFVEAPISTPEKFDAFKNLRAALKARLVLLPDDPVTVKDLKCLVKRETAGGHVTVQAPKRKGQFDDAADVVARIVRKLLPLTGALDIDELNRRATGDFQGPTRDWRERSREPELDGIPSGLFEGGGMFDGLETVM